jgi:hypothetical protein
MVFLFDLFSGFFIRGCDPVVLCAPLPVHTEKLVKDETIQTPKNTAFH